jgi:hypothetical protein
MPVLLGAADACPREPDERWPVEGGWALPYLLRYALSQRGALWANKIGKLWALRGLAVWDYYTISTQ